jgi:hypothetical protein
MQLTEKQVDMLVTGAVGGLGTIAGSVVTNTYNRLRVWLDERKTRRTRFREIIVQLQDTQEPCALAQQLRDLRSLLLLDQRLLTQNRSFYDRWLKDPPLDAGGHSEFSSPNCSDKVKELKDDLLSLKA